MNPAITSATPSVPARAITASIRPPLVRHPHP
jgi:hypothetical protein